MTYQQTQSRYQDNHHVIHKFEEYIPQWLTASVVYIAVLFRELCRAAGVNNPVRRIHFATNQGVFQI